MVNTHFAALTAAASIVRRHMLCAALWLACAGLQAQTISFTFDDGLDPRTQPDAAAWNARMLAALDSAGVQAMLFPAGKNVDSAAGLALVGRWAAAGHAVGNHSYAHRNFGSPAMSVGDFVADVLRADALLRTQATWQPRLRFPYLKEGDSRAKVDAFRHWMATHDYRPGAVSVDASDWYYDERLRSSRVPDAQARIQPLYIRHLLDRAAYYDGLARQVLGRSPAHVLLLHTNAINAALLPDVVAAFRAAGWRIVSPAQAYQDPLYLRQPQTLPAGESIVWSLAKEAGLPGLRYPAEDDVYEKPLLDAAGI